MGIKEQIKKITDNWLLILFMIGLFALPSLFTGIGTITRSGMGSYGAYDSYAVEEGSYEYMQKSLAPGMPYYDNRDFAPDEQDRKIMKTVSLSTEVEKGEYLEQEAGLKAIISSSGSFLLNENVNKYGEKNREYQSGYYTIKVDVTKYDSVMTQLKTIGEVKSFSQQNEDITGTYSDAKIELEAERSKLERYNQMFKEAIIVADRITLNDRIFDQERIIKYMQDAIENMDKTVEYSTIYFSMTEKRSDYADIVFVKFSELVQTFVGSINSMLGIIFVLLPWAIVLTIGIVIVKMVRHKSK